MLNNPTTPKGTDLEALAGRVEAAEGPSRALFVAAYEAVVVGTPYGWGARFLRLVEAEAWLDAAMSLVPEGWWFCAGRDGEGPYAQCAPTTGPRSGFITAATPALALCAAALHARSATPEPHPGENREQPK